ncbi:MAG: CHASE domain-containing protein [Aquabacterium sp.]
MTAQPALVRFLRWGWLPWCVLVMGMALSALAGGGLYHQVEASAHVRFAAMADRLAAATTERLLRSEQALASLGRLSAVQSGPVSARDLRIWTAARDVPAELPGVRAMSLIERVERTRLAAFVQQMQAGEAPGFAVRSQGQAPELFIVRAIEPLASNRQALGFDIGADPVRRQAIEAAIDSGLPRLSRAVMLVQDGGRKAGFLYLLPLYAAHPPPQTVAQRRASLIGLVSLPVAVDGLLAGLNETLRAQADFGLFEPGPGGRLRPLTDVRDGVAAQGAAASLRQDTGLPARFTAQRHVMAGGHDLSLILRSTPAFDADAGYGTIVWLPCLGIVLSAAAAMAIWLMQNGQARARALAQRMTLDLSQAKRQAEDASRESAALIHTLDQFSMVCITLPDGCIVDVNEALCRVSGYSRRELVGRNPRVLGAGRHEPLFWVQVWQTLLHGRPWVGQLCNRTREGQLYWTQCVIAPFHNAQGQVDKYISIAYDITQARRVQDELKASAERYNLAIDGGSDGLWDWMDVQTKEQWWSPQFYRLLGHVPGEIPASLATTYAMLHPDDQALVQEATRRALQEHEPFDVECRLRTRTGDYRWFRTRAKVYYDDFGEATRMAGSIQDVHDRKVAQATIKAQSQQTAAIFSLSPDGFVAFDAGGCVSYVSPAFGPLTGLGGRAILGLDEADFSQLLFGRAEPGQAVTSLADVRQLMQAGDGQVRAGAGAGQGLVSATRAVIQLQPPGRRTLELRLSLGDGGAVSQVLHLRDVTHETEVDQMKSAFLSMAAHELRTPMASIFGFTELLLTRPFSPDKQKDMLERIYRQSGTMASIINELLDLARIESRQGKDFAFASCDLAGLVADVIRDFKLPPEREAPLVQWPPEPVSVWVDRQKMGQALLNVLSNAYKYSPHGGDVILRFVQPDEPGRAVIGVQVEDHGIGLSPAQLARVGERFYRVDKSGAIPGTGLGMTIVKEIMEVLGGKLGISSEPARGTVVTLWLPCVDLGAAHKSAQSRDLQMLQLVTEFPAD